MGDGPPYASCLWCSCSTFMQSNLYDFFRPPYRKKDRLPWLKQAAADLCTCVDCMEEYHKLVQEAFESDSRFLDMRELVYRADTTRLEKYMEKVLQEHEDDLVDDLDSVPMTQTTAQLQASLKAPVQEMLKYPRLLLSKSVCKQFVRVFIALRRVDESPEIEEKYPGVYLLLVFPDQKIRHWAVSTVKSLGTLDWDDYDELEDVVKWLITVITFNLFVDPVQDVGSAAWNDEECVQLPKHLYTYSSPKEYWLGICMLVTAMDANCIRSGLMSSGASGHRQFIDTIINALAFQSDKNYAQHGRRKASCNTSKLTSENANSTIFWPAMQCLVVLLDRLQFRFWSFANQSAESVVKSILGNPYYHLELKRWSLNGKDEEEINSSEFESEVSANEVEDDSVSDSQVIYSWGSREKFAPQGIEESSLSQMSRHPSDNSELFLSPGRNILGKLRIAAFSWMFSFVHSLLDFGDMSDTVGMIFNAVHSIYQLALAGKRRFEFFHLTSYPGNIKSINPTIPKLSQSALCNESLLTLSRLAELLFDNSAYVPLLKFQSHWLCDVTEAIHALTNTSISGQSSEDRQQGLQVISPLPSALTHIAKLVRRMLTSSIAAELPMSINILSAISTSPSIKASIPTYQLQMSSSKKSLHRLATCNATLNLRGISEHLLLVLKKYQSLHDSSNPYLLLTETASFSTPEPPSVESSESTSNLVITPSAVAETSLSAGDPLPNIQPLHKTTVDSDSCETDVTPDVTSQEEDGAVLAGLCLSSPVQSQTNRAQDQLETSDSSDFDISATPLRRRPKKIQDPLETSDSSDAALCTTPLKRRPRPKGRKCTTTLARKQLNLLSDNTTDTEDFESLPVGGKHHAIASVTKQKQLLYQKRKKVKLSLKLTHEKSSSSAPDVTKTPRPQTTKEHSLSSKKSRPPVQAEQGYGHHKTSAFSRKERPRTSSVTHSRTLYKDDSGSSTEALSSDGEVETSSLQATKQLDKSNLSQITEPKGKKTKQSSSSKMQTDEEVIIISDDSDTTEPLSPTKHPPADSSVSGNITTRWCDQREVSSLETVKQWLQGSSPSPPKHTEYYSKHSKSAEVSSPFTEPSDDHYVFKDLTAEIRDEHSDDDSSCSSENSTSGALLQFAAAKHMVSKGSTSSISMQSSVHNKSSSVITQTVYPTPPVPKSSQYAILQPVVELKEFSVDVYRIPTKALKCGVGNLEEPATKEPCPEEVAVALLHDHHSSREGHVQKEADINRIPVHISHSDLPVNDQGPPPKKEANEGYQTSGEHPLLSPPNFNMPVNRHTETPTMPEASASKPFLHFTTVEAVTTQSLIKATVDGQIAKKLPSVVAKHNQVPHPQASGSNIQSEEGSAISEPIPSSEITKSEAVVLQQYAPDKEENTPSPSRISHEQTLLHEMSEITNITSTCIDLISLSSSENASECLSSMQTVPASVAQASSVGQTTICEKESSTFPCASKKRTEGSTQSDTLNKCREQLPPPKKVRFDLRPKSSRSEVSFKQPVTTASRNLGSTNAESSCVIRNIAMQQPDFMKPLNPPVEKIPRPVFINTRPTIQRKMDDLYHVILTWDPAKFLFPAEATDGRPIKPVLYQQPAAVPTVFRSYDQYCDIFTPLLHLELWENLYQDIHCSTTQKPPTCLAKVSSIESTEHPHFQMLVCTSVVSYHKAKINAHPLQRDLVIIDFQDLLEFTYVPPIGGVESNLNMRHRFAVVESLSRDTKIPESSENKTLDRSNNGGVKMTFRIKVFHLGVISVHFIENREIDIEIITSLTSTMRQWNGLINLHHNQLVRDILNPRGGVYFGLKPSHHYAPYEDCLPYNESQFKAIQTAVKTMSEPYANPRICLLQGPPGTGKTHTISGMIQYFFKTMNPQQSGRSVLPGQTSSHVQPSKPHLLVCSPSNAGIDEICRRLLNEGLVIGSAQWTRKYGSRVSTKGARENQYPWTASKRSQLPGFNVVRVGQENKIHPHVHCISLDELARKILAKDRNALQSADRIKKEIFDLQQEVDSLEKQRNVLRHSQSNSDMRNKMQKVEAELNKRMDRITQLKRQHKEEKFRQRSSQKEDASIRKKLLLNADVVFATLVGSGSSALMDWVRQYPLHFTSVIVDEASQCSELDVLIPLRYSSSKLILVGDPLQLPATVKSNKALSLGLGKSLFERLFTHFMELNEQENPIQMLQVQYRMLPEICQFPSTHFYQGKLQTHCCDQARALARFKPLQMFDIVQGQEIQRSGGICNMEECKLVVEICKVLLHSTEVTVNGIGIITPYKHQERKLKEVLHEKIHGSGTIDVGTVDSFQGREKDVIILSCVRAKSQTGSIGFLSSRQRMNVALTRSKRGLYIVGHFESLQVNKDWKALIEHGKKNKVIVSLDTSTSYTTAARAVLRPQGTPVNASPPGPSAKTSHTTLPAPKHSAPVASHSSERGASFRKRVAEHRDAERTPLAKRRKETAESEQKRKHSLPTPLLISPAGVSTVASTILSPSKQAQNDAYGELPLQSTSAESVRSPPFHCATDPHANLAYSDISDTSDSDQPPSPKPTRTDNRDIDYTAMFPTPPRNCPPACDSAWRPHGGPRKRVAHKGTGSIQRQRTKSVVIEESSGSPKKRNSLIDKIKKRV